MRFVYYTILTGKVNAPAVVRVAILGDKRGYVRVVARRDAYLGYRIAVDGVINAATAPEARDAVSCVTAQLTFTNDIIPAAACSKVWQCQAHILPSLLVGMVHERTCNGRGKRIHERFTGLYRTLS